MVQFFGMEFFFIEMMPYYPRNLGFTFLLNWSNRLDARILQLHNTLLCKLKIMVTITSHIFINIFKTVNFSTVIHQGKENNMSFPLIPKSQKV